MNQARDEVAFNPQMIILGRESRGISQKELATLLGFSQGKMSKVENGLMGLTQNEIMKISKVLNYPVGFFTRNKKIYGTGLSEYFHRKKQSVPSKKLNKIYARLEITRMHIQTLLSSVEMGESHFFQIDPDSYNGDIEKIAQITRATWRLPKGPIKNIVDVIEEAGGIIVPFDFEGANIDAISVWNPGYPPLIFTNFDRPMDRIRFTLAHEIGHLIMHQSPPSNIDDIEIQADQFASEFLMPRAEISSALNDVSLRKLAFLKPIWKVSMSALLKRAQDIGKITDRQARYFWMKMNKAGFRVQEPPELEPPREKPTILEEIIKVHYENLSYSVKDLCEILYLNEDEFRNLYSFKHSHLRVVK